jgi:hypothetical protein
MSQPRTVLATDGMGRGFSRVNGSVDEDNESIDCKSLLGMIQNLVTYLWLLDILGVYILISDIYIY